MSDANLPSTALAHLSSTPAAMAVYEDPARFEHYQRVANLFAKAELVPQHLRGKVADCFIGVCIAREMGVSPVMVLQNIYFVGGRAGWATQFMIARANTSGKFKGPLRWKTEGVGEKLSVTCYADLAKVEGESRVDVAVNMTMAKAEGWTKNSKYVSIPEQMLRWRSATWLIRLYAPEVMMGIPTQEELEDIAADPPKAQSRARTAAGQLAAFASPMLDHEPTAGDADVVDPETGEVTEAQAAADAPAIDWPQKLAALKTGVGACADTAALVAFKAENADVIKAIPDDVFADWSDFVEERAAALKGA